MTPKLRWTPQQQIAEAVARVITAYVSGGPEPGAVNVLRAIRASAPVIREPITSPQPAPPRGSRTPAKETE